MYPCGPPHGYWMYLFERFNSWVIKCVHNKQYPEATVVETYRLFEWAHYSQIFGHLPDNAILHPGDTAVAENTIRLKVGQLTTDQVAHLKRHYRSVMPQFNDLCLRYESEKRKARVRHKIRQFPAMPCWTPTSGSPLTTEELEMRHLQHDILQMGLLQFQKHVRQNCVANYQRVRFSTLFLFICFNKIVKWVELSLFHHIFCRSINTLAYVHWFNCAQQDRESEIVMLMLSVNHQLIPLFQWQTCLLHL